ncbi:MAG: T9SS type A sorting domain-containing protein, partial [Bacteroides sp.]|nr:T9SS type A sorting domain-containing protein [Bacteroides sp.]
VYNADEEITIIANIAPEGKEFDSWRIIAGEAFIASVDSATSILRVLSADAYVSAAYKDSISVGSVINSVEESVRIYPNPSGGLFQIEAPAFFRQTKFEIFSTLGCLVQTGYLEGRIASIDMQNAAKGTYILRLFTDATVYTELLVIK